MLGPNAPFSCILFVPQAERGKKRADRSRHRLCLQEVNVAREAIVNHTTIKAVFKRRGSEDSSSGPRFDPSFRRLEAALSGPEDVAKGARIVLRWMEAAYNVAVDCLNVKNKQWVTDCGDLSSLTVDDKVRACCMLAMLWTSLRMKHHVQTEMAVLTHKIVSRIT